MNPGAAPPKFGAQTPSYPSSRLQRHVKGPLPKKRCHVGWCTLKAQHPGRQKNIFFTKRNISPERGRGDELPVLRLDEGVPPASPPGLGGGRTGEEAEEEEEEEEGAHGGGGGGGGCSRRAAAGGHAASLCMHLQCNGREKTALSFTPNSRSRDAYQRTYQLMGVAHGRS